MLPGALDDDDLMDAIRNARRAYPHLRLGQLILNATTHVPDLFYLEDTDLIDALDDYVEKFS